jgi:hypothetical protein
MGSHMTDLTAFVVPVVIESGLWCSICKLSTGSLLDIGLMTERGFSPNTFRVRACERCLDFTQEAST